MSDQLSVRTGALQTFARQAIPPRSALDDGSESSPTPCPTIPGHPDATVRRGIAEALAYDGLERWDYLDDDYLGLVAIPGTRSGDVLGAAQVAAFGSSNSSDKGSSKPGNTSPPDR
jgi:hypothetical protein